MVVKLNKLSIVIPVYYNQETLQDVYVDLENKVFNKVEDYELIFVDDGSQDNSWAELEKIKTKDDKVKIIKLSRNFGSHAAILAGFNYATGDCVVIKAADLQEDSTLLTDMYDKWLEGFEVVLAKRNTRNDSFFGDMFSNTYYYVVNKMVSKNMPLRGFDCYLIDKKVVNVLKNLNENNSPLTLQILWSGFKVGHVYYDRLERTVGKSRWTLSKKVKLFADSIISFSYVPLRIMTVTGVGFFIFSIVWGIYTLLNKIFGNIQVEGYTTLLIVTLFSFGMIMFTLGILGEYIWRILDASRKRPVFIVDREQL